MFYFIFIDVLIEIIVFLIFWIKIKKKFNLSVLFISNSELDSLLKGVIYCIFKCNFCCEDYLLIFLWKLRNLFVKYRIINYYFFIEIGRWNNILCEDYKCGLCEVI